MVIRLGVMLFVFLTLTFVTEARAQTAPPAIAPSYTLAIPGFPGDDGNDAVAACGSEIFYVRFTDKRIRRLNESPVNGWVESDFAPQGSAAGFTWVRVYGNGNLLAALYETAYSAHRVDIFERNAAGAWSLKQSIQSPSEGSFVHLNQLTWSGTDLLVVDRYADSYRGAAFVFTRNQSGVWQQTAKLQGSGVHPNYTEVWSAALDGNQAILGHWLNNCGYGAVSGTAYVFEKNSNGIWSETAALRPPTAQCGDAYAANVTIRNGDAFASSPGNNRIYRFRKSPSQWTQMPDLPIPALSGNPAQGVRLKATDWGVIARSSDARLVAYAQFAQNYQPVAVLTPGVLPTADCYCWNIATIGTRVVTAYAAPGGGATLAIFELGTVIDCNGDGIADFGQIQSGQLADADANGVPDVCESTLYVPSQYATIQAAINAVPAGAARTIQVAPGTYPGPIDFLGKDIVLVGSGVGQSIIDGNGGQVKSVVYVEGSPATARLEGFTIRNGTTGQGLPDDPASLCGGGLLAVNSAFTVRNCRFEDNYATYGGGAYFRYGSAKVEHCEFVANVAASRGGGSDAFESTTSFADCFYYDNRAAIGGGMQLVRGQHVVERTRVELNFAGGTGGGVHWYADLPTASLVLRDSEIVDNTSKGNASGLSIFLAQSSAQTVVEGTTVCGNLPRNIEGGPYTANAASEVCDCRADVVFDGTVGAPDLSLVLGAWGPAAPGAAADINMDGIVNAADVSILLASWGACASQ